ncbi:hypothetical protein K503DRAFT_623515 [Rhizopogon vinicolor AM-OR11-026]|uniref:Uncharacterized protein n=1 Tax=Rhizopogon vinicolor AM-OR11-026 TaxID=1314800 RepID=A0A1B7MI56_9AGAM|nr:hypothetical protein K503DRAFT_623515 [Rhizopogon vinicolor AM-OR11-026]
MATSLSFAFVPRNVPKNRKQQGTSAHLPSHLSFEPTLSAKRESSYPAPFVIDKGKGKAPETTPSSKQVYNEKDIYILVVLAFSDYALWIDSLADPRRKTKESLQREEHDAGFLPLSYLMRCAFSRENLGHEHMSTEASVVKAIRTYADDVLRLECLYPLHLHLHGTLRGCQRGTQLVVMKYGGRTGQRYRRTRLVISRIAGGVCARWLCKFCAKQNLLLRQFCGKRKSKILVRPEA